MNLPHIPILRQGRAYESLDKVELKDVRTGESVATVSQANVGLIRRDLAKMPDSRQALRQLSTDELLQVCAAAGELFLRGELPIGGTESTQSPERYIQQLSSTTGLPHSLCRLNMAKIHQVFTQMPAILTGLTRGLDLNILDEGIGAQAGVPVCFHAITDALGVVLPSNSPGVNSIWMPAIPLKVPVALKPGREEPWTPWRIMQALIAAGCPPAAFSFYPTDHEGSNALIADCQRALLFGDESTIARYASNPAVQVHGPGKSKILIGADAVDRWPDYLEVMVDSIVSNGGRSCINASTIIVPAHGKVIAEALAQQLAAILPRPFTDPNALLAGFANAAVADAIDAAIDEGLQAPGAEDVAVRFRSSPRKVVMEGCSYLLPTLVRCDEMSHPLANREFMFPYVSVVEMPQERMLDEIGPSLIVTAITEDRGFIRQLLESHLIDRLNIGPIPTSRVRWDQPHEGNLFEFLYRRRAIQCAASAGTDA